MYHFSPRSQFPAPNQRRKNCWLERFVRFNRKRVQPENQIIYYIRTGIEQQIWIFHPFLHMHTFGGAVTLISGHTGAHQLAQVSPCVLASCCILFVWFLDHQELSKWIIILVKSYLFKSSMLCLFSSTVEMHPVHTYWWPQAAILFGDS